MYYFLQSRIGQYLINTIKSGSANPKFNKTDFKKIKFFIPPIPEQKAIANILSSFDKKIELLKEQNKTLEIMAQTIFKEWFVDFNYPNATGEMIDSEMGKIPDGWRVFKLEELVDTVNGYSYKGKELVEQSDEALVTLKSFNRNGGFQTRGFKPFKGNPKTQQEVKIGDLVVAHTDLTQDAEVLGNPAFIFENGGFKKMYITMDLVKVVSKIKDIDNAFLYYIMKDRRFKGHCVGYSNGTTVLHLSKKAIPEYKIALPQDLKLAKEFSNLVYSFTNKISNNIVQLKTLEDTRDKLLSPLVSGKLRVDEFRG
jgi:type I restriction enzyme S subunit